MERFLKSTPPDAAFRILRKPELLLRLGLSYPTIYRMERRGEFPRRIRLGAAAVGWTEESILSWLRERAAAADRPLKKPESRSPAE